MEFITERGKDYEDCVQKLQEKYGRKVKVMNRRKIRIGGIFGLFSREGMEVTGYISGVNSPSFPPYSYPAALPSSGGPDIPQKLMDFEQEKQKILAGAKGDTTLQLVLNEVRSIKEHIDASSPPAPQEHASLTRLEELLALNDFTPSYCRKILDRVRKEIPLEALDNFDEAEERVVEWIGESIKIHNEEKFHVRPRILIIVGPTGVGKTTTISKLAAIFGLSGGAGSPSVETALSVRMITIDNYRIGAKEQIETYGDIMGIPVSPVETAEELKKTIALYSNDADLILIDTIGKSPRDAVKLAEMKQFLRAAGQSADVYLAVSAGTKASDIKEILEQFEPFGYRSVILTKLDETTRTGNVISALADKGKSVAYICDGQRVPTDIEKASVVRFLINLEGFRVNRRKIETLFPQTDSENFTGDNNGRPG